MGVNEIDASDTDDVDDFEEDIDEDFEGLKVYHDDLEKLYPILVKADTSSGLASLSNILHTTSLDAVVSGIGRVTKYDVDVAALYETIIIAYNIQISKEIHEYATSKGVYIEQGDVLPDLLSNLFHHFDIDVGFDTKKLMGEVVE